MTTEPQPLHWIQLELIPLPSSELKFPELLLWWNPDEKRLEGQGAESILQLIDDAMALKRINDSRFNHVELTDPLAKPSELAAILAQYFWVIPQPVKSPGLPDSEFSDKDSRNLQ
ncbi:MAG: hypothetical protein R3189_00475 [Thiomicrorhabdus chilensis]|uniref:hypothetical protein n=1 Tax=Thiomicrorhabdus chilensis TaxID=63656 RepID=UPI00299EB949|nr:hypothetical protein [Thiomicrorhabdus chilensis]MDX1346701.1 hypothetical protein [Thiomicrorhabdus chilensis]